MEIQITCQKEIPGIEVKTIEQKLEIILEDLGCHDKELSILFTDDGSIARLNEQYLNRKGPTNVLAFPMAGELIPGVESTMLGDVVVSVDTAIRESKGMCEPLAHTIDRLLIHGVLHLLNYDHEKSMLGAERMEKEEKRLMALITLFCTKPIMEE